jgi:hypothetical protein
LWRQLLGENEQLMAKYSCHCLSTSKWTHLGRHRSASTPRWNSQWPRSSSSGSAWTSRGAGCGLPRKSSSLFGRPCSIAQSM